MTLTKPENQDTEFKQSWQDEYLKWICAFANTKGGTIYIGVHDKGEVLGLSDFHKLSEAIPLKIRQTMGLLVDVHVLTADDDETKKYLKIYVEKYPFPVSYHGKYYKRVGSTTQEVIGVELDRMILSVQGRTWDSIPVPNVQVSDLDERAFQIFKKRAMFTHRLTEEQLSVDNKDLIHNLHGFENDYLTRATVLSFHPDPEQWFTGAFIKIAYFVDDANILYQDEVHGPLLVQVERAMEIIYTKYMKALIDYDGIARRETYFFPHDAFRELLLNALIHRDYMNTAPIQIQIFKDKIDIWNIGKMPDDMKLEDLFTKHRSEPRNPNIANVFFRCGYIESWGRGYFKIQELCNKVNANLPEPENLSGGISVVCSASKQYMELATKYGVDGTTSADAHRLHRDCTEIAQRLHRDCPDFAQKTYDYICSNPYSTIKEISEKLDISIRTVNYHIAALKKAELIERIGSDTSGHWIINNN